MWLQERGSQAPLLLFLLRLAMPLGMFLLLLLLLLLVCCALCIHPRHGIIVFAIARAIHLGYDARGCPCRCCCPAWARGANARPCNRPRAGPLQLELDHS